jgi:hypothetical protein
VLYVWILEFVEGLYCLVHSHIFDYQAFIAFSVHILCQSVLLCF